MAYPFTVNPPVTLPQPLPSVPDQVAGNLRIRDAEQMLSECKEDGRIIVQWLDDNGVIQSRIVVGMQRHPDGKALILKTFQRP